MIVNVAGCEHVRNGLGTLLLPILCQSLIIDVFYPHELVWLILLICARKRGDSDVIEISAHVLQRQFEGLSRLVRLVSLANSV